MADTPNGPRGSRPELPEQYRGRQRTQFDRPGGRRPPHVRDGEEIIGEDEAVDHRWLDSHAEERRRRWQEERRALDGMLAREREALPLWDRIKAVLEEAARLQGAPAGPITSSTSTSDERSPGGRRPPSGDTVDLSEHLVVIEARVREMERELDVYSGRTADARARRQLDGDEKDRILREQYEGVHYTVVAEAAPFLGSARTVFRHRRNMGLKGSDGTPEET